MNNQISQVVEQYAEYLKNLKETDSKAFEQELARLTELFKLLNSDISQFIVDLDKK